MKKRLFIGLQITAWIGFALLAISVLAQNQTVALTVLVKEADFADPRVQFFVEVIAAQGDQTRQGTDWKCEVGTAGKNDGGTQGTQDGWGLTSKLLGEGDELKITAQLDGNDSLSVQKLEKPPTPPSQKTFQKKNSKAPPIECKLQPESAKK